MKSFFYITFKEKFNLKEFYWKTEGSNPYIKYKWAVSCYVDFFVIFFFKLQKNSILY